MIVFDLLVGSGLMLTELLGDLLGRGREAGKPPADPVITAVVAGSLPPRCDGFVAGIEDLLVRTCWRAEVGRAAEVRKPGVDKGEDKRRI